ncbi:MAG: hypothetical protein Q9218_003180 [Villophora microphyllina]
MSETKHRDDLKLDNTVLATENAFADFAVLVCEHAALNIYVLVDLRETLMPALTVLLKAMYNLDLRQDGSPGSVGVQMRFFETGKRIWEMLEWNTVLKDIGLTDGSHVRMTRPFA